MAGIDRVTGPDGISTPIARPGRSVDNDKNSEAPGFSLPMDEDPGVIYEPSGRQKASGASDASATAAAQNTGRASLKKDPHAGFDGPGVEVDLSTQGMKSAEAVPAPGILDSIRDLYRRVKEFFIALWNGTDETVQSAVTEEEEASEITADVSDSQPLADIPVSETGEDDAKMPILSNDAEAIAAFMVNYGGRHLAKNSDLLTQYDRSGHLTGPNASDRRRILQGDRTTTKL